MKKIRIALAGGGSGGHVYPMIAVAQALKEQPRPAGNEIELHYFGPDDRFRNEIEAQGIRFHPLMAGKLRRYASALNIIDVPKFLIGIVQAFFKMYALMPDVLFSKGGPGALAPVLAAWFYKVPVVIHETDSVPGLTTMLSARFSRKIAVSWEQALQYFNPKKAVLTGNPVRPELMTNRLSQEEAKRKLGFDPTKPLLFVTGGSFGAMKLNEFIILNLGQLLPVVQVLHQTGAENFIEMKKLSEAELVQLPPSVSTQSRYLPMGYLGMEETRDALSAADIILSRAGGAIFEAAAFGKPMILVPLSSAARDHQRENAQAFSQTGGGLVLDEANLSINIFMSELQTLLANPTALQSMGQLATAFAKPDAARAIAAIILGLA